MSKERELAIAALDAIEAAGLWPYVLSVYVWSGKAKVTLFDSRIAEDKLHSLFAGRPAKVTRTHFRRMYEIDVDGVTFQADYLVEPTPPPPEREETAVVMGEAAHA